MVIAMAFTAVFFLMLAIRGSTIGVRQYLRHGSADRDGAAFDQLVDGRRIDPRILQYPDAVLAPPHDASGHTWHHPDEQLIEMTRNGASGIVPGYQICMPGLEDNLRDREIEAVLSYRKRTWP